MLLKPVRESDNTILPLVLLYSAVPDNSTLDSHTTHNGSFYQFNNIPRVSQILITVFRSITYQE